MDAFLKKMDPKPALVITDSQVFPKADAAVPREKAVRRAVREFSRRVLDGVLSPFVAYYAEEGELSEEDLTRLEAIVQRHRSKKGGRRP